MTDRQRRGREGSKSKKDNTKSNRPPRKLKRLPEALCGECEARNKPEALTCRKCGSLL